MISTWKVRCGIATYAGDLSDSLAKLDVEVAPTPIDRTELSTLGRKELCEQVVALSEQSRDADLVHIQHEFGFFAGAYDTGLSNNCFAALLEAIEPKKTVITFHTNPPREDVWGILETRGIESGKQLGRLGIRYSMLRFLKNPGLPHPFVSVVRTINQNDITCFAHSGTTRRRLVDAGIRPELIRVIPLGITPTENPSFSEHELAELKQSYGIPPRSFVITIFGFVSRYKGYLSALTALKLLGDDVQLLIAGGANRSGGDRFLDELLAALDEDPEVASRVHITGHVPESGIAEVIAMTDIFIAPYEADSDVSGSAAITIGLSSGKPVIASNIEAFRRMGNEYQAVELVTPNSPYELADAVTRVSRTPRIRTKLIDGARDYVEQHTWENVGRVHIKHYEEILAQAN